MRSEKKPTHKPKFVRTSPSCESRDVTILFSQMFLEQVIGNNTVNIWRLGSTTSSAPICVFSKRTDSTTVTKILFTHAALSCDQRSRVVPLQKYIIHDSSYSITLFALISVLIPILNSNIEKNRIFHYLKSYIVQMLN